MTLDRDLVFIRTEQGEREFKTRCFKLAQRLRTILILINGERSVENLRFEMPNMADLDDRLEELALEGFITPLNTHWQNVEKGDEAAGTLSVQAIKARMIDNAILILGKSGNPLVKKLETTADSLSEIRNVCEECLKKATLIADQHQLDELKQRWDLLCKSIGDAKTDAVVETPAVSAQDWERIQRQMVDVVRSHLGKNSTRIESKILAAPLSQPGLQQAVKSSCSLVKLIIDEKKADTLCAELNRLVS